MKKIIILGLGAIAFALSSCIKTNNCECTTFVKDTGDTYVSNDPITGVSGLGGGKKARKIWCESNAYENAFERVTCKLTK